MWERSEEIIKKTQKSISAITSAEASKPSAAQEHSDGVNPQLIDAVVAAIKGRGKGNGKGGGKGDGGARARSQSPRNTFPKEHCYHCGKHGHSRTANGTRQGCPDFAKLLKDNGGRLPDGYKGAFEKHVEAEKKKRAAASKRPVTAILEADDSEDESSDDDLGFKPCGAFMKRGKPSPCCQPFAPDHGFAPTPTCNSFQHLTCEDDCLADEDNVADDDVVTPLEGWAHSVKKASEKKANKKKGKGLRSVFKIESEEDVEKLGHLLCGSTNKKKRAKTWMRLK